MKKLAWILITVLASARATRFFTTDFLGEWTIVGPAKRWAARDIIVAEIEQDEERRQNVNDAKARLMAGDDSDVDALIAYGTHWPGASKRARLVKGFDCPYCIGFWVGAVMLALLPLRKVPVLGHVVSWCIGAFALNYVVGHAVSKWDL